MLATAAVTLLRHREDRTLRNLAIASLPLLALQAWLGKVTVERELPPEIVTLHLSMALLLLAVLALIAAFAFLGPERRRIEDPQRAVYLRLAISASVMVAVTLIAGRTSSARARPTHARAGPAARRRPPRSSTGCDCSTSTGCTG